MKVLKFGGSSLSTPATVRQVGKILLAARRREPLIVVVSAFEGVTNRLLDCARLAERADPAFEEAFKHIARRHRDAVTQLIKQGRARVRDEVDALLAELHSTLEGIHLLRHCPVRALDMTASFGERLSALIVAAHLARTHPAAFVDARDFLVTDDQFTHANVIFKKTNRRTRAYFSQMFRRSGRTIPIVTGFIGATEDGQTTTIGRNGSDYSAAIVAAAVGASEVQIWTDVDGLLTCDPRFVPSARVIDHLSHEEAAELASFGAKLHPRTLEPAIEAGIPVRVLNTHNPASPGTLITREGTARATGPRSVARKRNVTVVHMTSNKMLGAHGFLARLFEVFEQLEMSVDLITTSEVSVSVTIDEKEHLSHLIERLAPVADVEVSENQCIMAIVGRNLMRDSIVGSRVFEAMRGIPMSMFSLGTSGLNLSIVVDEADADRSVRAIHAVLFEAAVGAAP